MTIICVHLRINQGVPQGSDAVGDLKLHFGISLRCLDLGGLHHAIVRPVPRCLQPRLVLHRALPHCPVPHCPSLNQFRSPDLPHVRLGSVYTRAAVVFE